MSDIKQMAEEFQALRAIPSHFSGGEEWIPEVDSHNGKKHELMKSLQTTFGQAGTPASEVILHLGKPDELSPTLNPQEGISPLTMPGPALSDGVTSAPSNSSYYLIYHWRGRHDYAYFKVDAEAEKVLESGWYNALE
ncbi:hypothetical protein K493DRAFT_410884 [Basidiobolus meristosporus CBS 931.73]|uniref:Uncharacterized protein n=1 Tax=Basidiobolus meristosporus CBS 931.73 TaxID=1314790 RepID=A0A1Y1XSD5_9FUNG|nr:hypothetical protein K493DRAFT_410884 [Basidiobolus meristosporus CBS 931.73]|eukprot:ORX88667.1 hypothetical protein K493DRAFT_410884 [Basidiobolus meristosporus CBS 931.73]